ncbi:S41 family peptidase [Sphingopyxis sp.]|uniref:S41 family peptidase n=1 Tax=Sphingopyxis sp. TaxID=1908224 RepID=UPI002B46615A|nr:S41 family peptidase [Sphingopyxis sp.]HJS12602.1 S41 family peptidase [Sphingopyxis sp.]
MAESGQSVAAVTLAALMLASCGGGGGSSTAGSGGPVTVTPTPSPTPTPTANCALASRQAFAKAVIDEWYLFPSDVANVSAASHNDVQSYIDALVAPARALNKDRFFTYITSIAEENAFYASGSSAGFGVRMSYDAAGQRILIAEAYESAPAFAAGIDRGTAIVAIGTNSGNLRTVASIVAAEGTAGLTNALGPNDPGVSRVLRITDTAGTRDVTVAKADYSLDPVSDRYGAKIITEGGRSYGYLNLRTFITSANDQLKAAFADFGARGVTDIIIDFRYNGGGLVSTANLMGDLMGANRAGQIFSQTRFRPSKSAENEEHRFTPVSQSIAPTRIAFIGTGSTASASELVINSMLPHLGTNMTLVGGNTYGKPVGQIALDKAECDDRMRVVAFATANSTGAGDYYDGLAPKITNSCAAGDDLTVPLGDPREASIRAAIGFLSGTACTTQIADASAGAAARSGRSAALARPEMLTPERPSAAQRELPGLF